MTPLQRQILRVLAGATPTPLTSAQIAAVLTNLNLPIQQTSVGGSLSSMRRPGWIRRRRTMIGEDHGFPVYLVNYELLPRGRQAILNSRPMSFNRSLGLNWYGKPS